MGRDYHFHCEHDGCSVTVGVHLGGARALELLVDGKEVAAMDVHGHHAQLRSLTTVLPTQPPRRIDVQVALPGPVRGEPASVLVDNGTEFPMLEREVPRRARLTEASWYS
ncbi:hypothetical protein [Kitasatospora sp. Root107]|uniref:hypothetical protein n=1 Tax=Kitasatospora sp. Root107 TaxID=1736424 RepID=UPI000A56C27C|nr:hypothetical protein [Kitasatospora sp. Root107]